MTTLHIAIILIVLLIIAGLPPLGLHSYGWAPSGGFSVLLAVLLLLLLIR